MGGRSDLVGAGKQRRQPAPDHPEEREQRDSRVLGSGDFVEQLLLHTEAEPIPAKVPLEEIIARVREKFDLSLTELTSQTRAQRVANARSIICHLAFACGHRGVDIARRLGITGSGVTIAAQRGKKVISEDPGLFAMIDGLGWLRI